MWVGEKQSAKFWAMVLNGMKNRGVEDIFIACTDNLTGFAAAIEAVFPKTELQNCIIHQLRNSSKFGIMNLFKMQGAETPYFPRFLNFLNPLKMGEIVQVSNGLVTS